MSELAAVDNRFMTRAVQLAQLGLYTTSPNPRVGCVLVREGQIIGEGYHQRAGEGHAEVNALRVCEDPRGATAYVTLEPCSHYGRTPPCAQGLINAGIRRVVIGMVDPNPQVAGRGIAMLEQAGIEVCYPIQEAACQALNPGFCKRMEQGLPWLSLKLASSLDGRTAMASGESFWITGPQARRQVQRLRARSCAVLTGIGTVLTDDPALTVRTEQLGDAEPGEPLWDGRQPLRVVLDRQLRLPPQARLLREPGAVLVIAQTDAPSERCQALVAAGAEVVCTEDVSPRAVLALLAQRGCNEVLLECGATLAGAFWEAGLVDQLHWFMAPTLLGSQARPLLTLPFTQMAQQQRVQIDQVRQVGDDWWFQLRPTPPQES